MSDDSKFVPSTVYIPRNKQPWATPDFNPYGTSNTSILKEGNESMGRFKAFGTFVKKNVEDYLKKVETSQGMTDELLGGSGLSGVGGLAGTFIGESSPLFDKATEQFAKEMKAKGFSAREIWEKTQNRFWKSGTRQEIDDSVMELRNIHKVGIEDSDFKVYYDTGLDDVAPTTMKDLQQMDNFDPFKVYTDTRLGSLIKHPELFKAYPDLKQTRVIVDPTLKGGNASFNPGTETIRIGLTPSGAIDSQSLLHEIQHSIQTREGWQNGGNPKQFKPKMMLTPKGDMIKVDSFKQYQSLAGEWEARISQSRDFLDTEGRKINFPDDWEEMSSGNLKIHDPKYNLPASISEDDLTGGVSFNKKKKK